MVFLALILGRELRSALQIANWVAGVEDDWWVAVLLPSTLLIVISIEWQRLWMLGPIDSLPIFGVVSVKLGTYLLLAYHGVRGEHFALNIGIPALLFVGFVVYYLLALRLSTKVLFIGICSVSIGFVSTGDSVLP